MKEFRTVDASVEPFPWTEASFDCAVAWCVFPHLENPFHAIRETARVLAPGGLCIFSAPYVGSKPSRAYFRKHGDFKSYRATNNHVAIFTPGVIQKTVLKYFELVATEYHFRPKVFRGWKGKLRHWVWKMVNTKQKKRLAKRWSYNAIYILRKPSV